MSDFIELFCDMLPSHSELHKKDNQLRQVLDKTVGEYMDNQNDILDELFLTTATGGWLDAHGKDYNVFRKENESDDDYRDRIIFEKLEYLTVDNLEKIFKLTLYCYVKNYNPLNNQLTSDNPYLSNKYMAYASDEIKKILKSKFVMGDGITWL